MLISGCQASETSADAHPPGQPDKAFGALTNALTTTVRKFKEASEWRVQQALRLAYFDRACLSSAPSQQE
jgi:hypothetical protein